MHTRRLAHNAALVGASASEPHSCRSNGEFCLLHACKHGRTSTVYSQDCCFIHLRETVLKSRGTRLNHVDHGFSNNVYPGLQRLQYRRVQRRRRMSRDTTEQREARLQHTREHRRRRTAAETGEQREARLQRARA